VREYQLPPDEAKAYFDSQAQELLQTINLYLGLIADIVKSHEGTLDKYIGDCVMAFWGAPVAQEKHAVLAVRAAIESQRAIHELNQRRADENKRLQAENHARLASGQKPLPLLKLLLLGTGINTGTVTIGLMGSDAHIVNYTVFGREVNLASRLENVSGRGRILIGENTFKHLHKFAPELAAKCEQQAPMLLKGFLQPIQSYSVNWKNSKLASGSEQAIPDAEVEV
jgi:class 3 adenylate cyclase